MQDGGKVQMPGLVKIYGAVYGKQIRPAYGFIRERSPREARISRVSWATKRR